MKAQDRRGPRLLYWSESTAGVDFETGIQRVVRRLGQGLARDHFEIVPIGWDREHCLPTALNTAQQASLGLAGRAEQTDPFAGTSCDDWVFIPEIPGLDVVSVVDVTAIGRSYGLRTAAIVHDLIPIKFPHFYEPAVVAFFDRYYRLFATVDLAIATTLYVAEDLRRHLLSRCLPVPRIVVCPLPAELPGIARRTSKPVGPEVGACLRLLTVSSWEPRKNLPRLLRAIDRVASAGCPVELTIVGHNGLFPAYDAEVIGLAARMSGVTILPRVQDQDLVTLFDRHHASIYPSWEEGFGLPILESLWLATPCLCHNASSMAEVAPGGGTMMLDMMDETAVAATLERVALDLDLRERLTDEAIIRPLATWADHAAEVARNLGPRS